MNRLAAPLPAQELQVRVVDCDVHPYASPEELAEYTPEPWRSRYYRKHLAETDPPVFIYQAAHYSAMRDDAIPPDGGFPGSDPEFTATQLLRDSGVDYAMLYMLQPRSRVFDPEFESASLAAANTVLAETWLSKGNPHERFRGSIRVSTADPDGAVREIEKWAGHPWMSQVFVMPEVTTPFGHPQYHRIWEAAARHDLPVASHINIHGGGMRWLTPVGFPSYMLEQHSAHAARIWGHITSLIFEGVFEKYPKLRFVWTEEGFCWIPYLLWRLDNYWRALGAETPAVRKPPSSYIRDHMRFATQPIEDVEPFRNLVRGLDWVDASDLLMFSSDYPHADYDAPDWVRRRLPDAWRQRILCDNAIEFYNLPRFRKRDALDEEIRGGEGSDVAS